MQDCGYIMAKPAIINIQPGITGTTRPVMPRIINRMPKIFVFFFVAVDEFMSMPPVKRTRFGSSLSVPVFFITKCRR